MLTVSARPNPLKTDTFVCEMEAGPSLLEILGDIGPHYVVTINGSEVPRDFWAVTIPGDRCLITAVNVPQGPVKAIALVVAQAVAAAASAAAAAIGAAFGAIGGAMGSIAGALGSTAFTIGGVSVSWGTVAMVGISVIGTVVQALIAPQMPTQKSMGTIGSRYSALQGGQNQIRKYQPLPLLLGQFMIIPPVAGEFITEAHGAEQFMRGLLCLGYGPLSIGGNIVGRRDDNDSVYPLLSYNSGTDSPGDKFPEGTIRLGETSIENFRGVRIEIGDMSQISLYTKDIHEQSLSVDFKHSHPGGENAWFSDNVEAVRTTDEAVKRIGIEIDFGALVTMSKMGNEREAIVEWRIDFSRAEEQDWSVVRQATFNGVEKLITGNVWETKGTSRTPKRFVWEFDVPEGRYDVRVRRIRTWIRDENMIQTDAVWTALRSIKSSSPWNYDVGSGGRYCVMMAVRIKNSRQLNGVIEAFRVLATSVVPVWNGSAWNYQASRNPAWLYVRALRGPQVKYPVPASQVELEEIMDWGAWCTSMGITYNFYLTERRPLLDHIKAIATCGRASWAMLDGRFSVVRENRSENGTEIGWEPIQMLSPDVVKNFRMERSFPRIPHAVRVRLVDPNTWQEAEIPVFDDGYSAANAQDYQELETEGVTDYRQAYMEGRYFLGVLKLRQETYYGDVGPRNLAATRGDCIRLAYDVLLNTAGWGRVRSVTLNGDGAAVGAVLDTPISMEPGTAYCLRVELVYGPTRVRLVNLVNPVAAPASLFEVDFAAPVPDLARGDRWTFGPAGKESALVKISGIQYKEGFEARLTMIPAAIELKDIDDGPIPPFDPGLVLPPSQIRPPAPIITNVSQLSDTVRILPNGSVSHDIWIAWRLPTSRVPVDLIEVFYEAAGIIDQSVLVSAESVQTAISDVPAGVELSIRVRARSVWQRWGEFSPVKLVTTEAASASGANKKLPGPLIGDKSLVNWLAANAVVGVRSGRGTKTWTTTAYSGEVVKVIVPATEGRRGVVALTITGSLTNKAAGTRRYAVQLWRNNVYIAEGKTFSVAAGKSSTIAVNFTDRPTAATQAYGIRIVRKSGNGVGSSVSLYMKVQESK
jgi:hypothetical protein